jgi:hypothetical protein
MNRGERQSRFSQPLLQIGCASVVVEIEMRPGGDQLDGIEPRTGDLAQVIAAQPLRAIEVCGDGERNRTARSRE